MMRQQIKIKSREKRTGRSSSLASATSGKVAGSNEGSRTRVDTTARTVVDMPTDHSIAAPAVHEEVDPELPPLEAIDSEDEEVQDSEVVDEVAAWQRLFDAPPRIAEPSSHYAEQTGSEGEDRGEVPHVSDTPDDVSYGAHGLDTPRTLRPLRLRLHHK